MDDGIQREFSNKDFCDRGDRNVTSLCSGLDSSTVYKPPSSLQYPGDFPRQRKGSESGSGSGSGSESSASSGAEDQASGDSRRASVETKMGSSRKSSDVPTTTTITSTSEHPHSESSKATPTTLSTPSTSSHHLPSSASSTSVAVHREPVRQSSFGSGGLFGQIASQAKELVKETKRQSSQEGLLSQVDKVCHFRTPTNYKELYSGYHFSKKLLWYTCFISSMLSLQFMICYAIPQLKSKTKEKLSEVRHSSSSGSEDHSFLAPLEQVYC